MDVLASLLLALGCVLASMTLAALRARQLGVVAVVDVAWGLGFVLVAAATTLLGAALGTAEWRSWLVLALVAVWGGRLGWHVRSRAIGEHQGKEDPRYEQMLGGSLAEVGLGTAVRRVFAVQGVAQWFVAVPIAVGAGLTVEWAWVVWLGVAVWALGFFFEAVGDWQLAQFKKDPDNKGKIMDQGLWRYTRHPNYFGDACVWAGIWLVAASSWAGVATVVSPIAMTIFLTKVTGAANNEKGMRKSKPGYDDYVRRTSGFIPLPPKKA